MDQFKLLAVTVLYSSLRVRFNQNRPNHKDIETFLKSHRFLTAQCNVQYVCNQRTIRLSSILWGEGYSRHRHSICSRL